MRQTEEPAADLPATAARCVREPVQAWDDPYARLDDLMCVVEALCPEWPPRLPSKSEGQLFRL